MYRDLALGWIATAGTSFFAVLSASDWNALVIPLVVGVLTGVSCVFKIMRDRREVTLKNIEIIEARNRANIARNEAILKQQAVCAACISGHRVRDCKNKFKPINCPLRCNK